MKLHEHSFMLPRDEYGDKVPQDLRRMYGGTLKVVESGGQRAYRFRSSNQLVGATAIGDPVDVTAGWFNDSPASRVGAVSRTALVAYQQRSGVIGQRLAVEVPGTRARQEWLDRWVRAEPKSRTEAYSTCDTPGFLAGVGHAAGQSPREKRLRRLNDNETQRESAVETVRRGLVAGDMRQVADGWITHLRIEAEGEGLRVTPLEETVPDHTIFWADGDFLPDAAATMVKYYGEFTFHADDPERAVVDCLGATTMTLEQFGGVWADAMAQPSPVAAGQFVLRRLL